jgi:L-fuculose-phosphate aldolase
MKTRRAMTKRYVENPEDAVLAAAKAMLAKGLTEGTAGNVSARREDGTICITPSSVDYQEMTLEDLVVIDTQGSQLAGHRPASSEKHLHLACYEAFEEVGSVIHAHPIHATMFAVAHKAVPACLDEFAIYVGGEVQVTEYAMSATEAVGKAAVACLERRAAALLANHGMVAIGKTPAEALHVVALVERTAQIAAGALALGGIKPLPESSSRSFAQIYDLIRKG